MTTRTHRSNLFPKCWLRIILFLLLSNTFLVARVQAAFDIAFGSDDDLTSFVTRPDIKAPVLDVKIYDKDAIIPGKWFIGPYAEIAQEKHPRNYYQACQSGPHIYDLEGVGSVHVSGLL
jgi:hypothetical protein